MLDYIVTNLKEPTVVSIFLAYAGGVIASLSPCVYPMIPVVIGVVGTSKVESKRKGFTLSFSYALGLALVYSMLGMIAGLTGSIFGEISSNPWSYLVFGNTCLILSFWTLGWISLPSFAVEKKSNQSGHIGVFITGLLSGLVAAPCTSAVLGGLLMYISTTKSVALGGMMLFAFSFGMTTLLIVIGTFSGILKTLPKPGNWMQIVKKALALILFVFAEYFLLKAGGGIIL